MNGRPMDPGERQKESAPNKITRHGHGRRSDDVDGRKRQPPAASPATPVDIALPIAIQREPIEEDKSRKRAMDEEHMRGTFATALRLVTMTMVQGVNKHGHKAIDMVYNELAQLHRRKSWKAVFPENLTKKEWKDVIPSHMLYTEKFTPQGVFKRLKARLVANGKYQQWLTKKETTSDAVHRDSLLAMSVMAAKEEEINFLRFFVRDRPNIREIQNRQRLSHCSVVERGLRV